MRGTVSDLAFRPIANADIEVIDGPQAGRTTRSNASGEFAFSGSFTDGTRFQATKEQYVGSLFAGPARPQRQHGRQLRRKHRR